MLQGLLLNAKLSENRLNVKVSSLGESRSIKGELKDVQPARCEDQQSIARICGVFERTELVLRLQVRRAYRACKLSPLSEPVKRRVCSNDDPAAHETESACFSEIVFSNRPQIVTEVVELEKPIRFKDEHMIVGCDKDFVGPAKPRTLIIDVAKGSLVTDVFGKLHDTEVIAIEDKEITEA